MPTQNKELRYKNLSITAPSGDSIRFRVMRVLERDRGWQQMVELLMSDNEVGDIRLDNLDVALVALSESTAAKAEGRFYEDQEDADAQAEHDAKVQTTIVWTQELIVLKRLAQSQQAILELDVAGYTSDEIISYGHDAEIVEAVLEGQDDDEAE